VLQHEKEPKRAIFIIYAIGCKKKTKIDLYYDAAAFGVLKLIFLFINLKILPNLCWLKNSNLGLGALTAISRRILIVCNSLFRRRFISTLELNNEDQYTLHYFIPQSVESH
jgi:hypothetical protein